MSYANIQLIDFVVGFIELMRDNKVFIRKTQLGYLPHRPRVDKKGQVRISIIKTAWQYAKRENWDRETFVEIVASLKSCIIKDGESLQCMKNFESDCTFF